MYHSEVCAIRPRQGTLTGRLVLVRLAPGSDRCGAFCMNHELNWILNHPNFDRTCFYVTEINID